MKRILVNATQQKNCAWPWLRWQELYDLDIELTGNKQKKSNIYKAKIVRIEPSLEAAFVDYGAPRTDFSHFGNRPELLQEPKCGFDPRGRKHGQELIVQVSQDERATRVPR